MYYLHIIVNTGAYSKSCFAIVMFQNSETKNEKEIEKK